MKEFTMQSRFGPKSPTSFNEETAPKWLCEGGVKGSTMDNRWFWTDHVLTLRIGSHFLTDFQEITRIN